ncbi:hypothetical protein [Acinetobacter populi]|uniref:DUF2059 domain-containing protein n=1 Tax=Acinetobacter populi TaxID=1582270 RepID=A0A1Z9Z1C8_9GAMM|nr:hypothetical protein [Acinetobacter populi]OUY08264.1 hypothetical protein CAP51_01185 [Acinetobacter populi]
MNQGLYIYRKKWLKLSMFSKLYIFTCMCILISGSSIVQAAPVSEQTTQQFFKLIDEDNILIQKKVNSSLYHQYALSRVYSFLGGEQPLNAEQRELVAEIEKLYMDMDTARLNSIRSESFETYKELFETIHSEESVQAQLNFMSSSIGQSILSKQPQRQVAIQQLYLSLPIELSQQADLQDALRSILNK